MISEREQFSAAVWGGSIYHADAIVVLMGQDARVRLACAAQLLHSAAAKVVLLTGALDNPPALIGAVRGGGMLLGLGVAPDRVLIEPTARNTYEQGVEAAKLAALNEWERVLLVASGYHLPRAYLTFLRAFTEAAPTRPVHLVPMPAPAPWFTAPPGEERSRLELLVDEYGKIDEYGARGHVASYRDGLDALAYWEAGGPEQNEQDDVQRAVTTLTIKGNGVSDV